MLQFPDTVAIYTDGGTCELCACCPQLMILVAPAWRRVRVSGRSGAPPVALAVRQVPITVQVKSNCRAVSPYGRWLDLPPGRQLHR